MSDRTYHLNPPDRTGVILGLGLPQCITLGSAMVVGVFAARFGAPLIVVPLLLVGAALVALVPLSGLPLVEWGGPMLRWARSGGRKGQRWFAPLLAINGPPVTTPTLPPAMAGQEVLACESRGEPAAVVHDKKAGNFAATLRVSGRQFSLLERGEQDALLGMWGDALAPFSRQGSPVVEVRWSEWAAPSGMEEQLEYIADHAATDANAPAMASYRDLLRTAGPAATRHEVLVTVVLSQAKVRMGTRHHGDRTQAAIEALLEEMRLLARRLNMAGLAVSAVLSPAELCRALRVRLDPRCMAALDRRGRTLGDRAGLVAPADGGPSAVSTSWGHWQADASVHRAFYFHEWPRFEVGPDWMANLLLYGASVRSVAVCYHPVSARASQRAILRQAAKLESDADQRVRSGFRVGAHHRRASRAVEEREEELVAGFAEQEYIGIVDVCCPDLESLEKSAAEVIEVSAGCGIELRPLDGRHVEGVAACLPLCRGVAQRTVKA